MKLLKKQFLSLKKEIGILIEKDKANYGYLQNYLYFFYAPLFTYTESIILLCENKNYISASVIMRSLVEAHIKIIYHQTDSKHRLASLVKLDFEERIKEINKIRELIKKHPNLESVDAKSLFSFKRLKELESINKTNLEAVLKGNQFADKYHKKLFDKATECDKEFVKNAKSGHFEEMYITMYGYLSLPTHLNFAGLEMFKEKQNKKDSKILITEAIGICVAYVKDLYENNVISGKIPKLITEIENLLKSQESF